MVMESSKDFKITQESENGNHYASDYDNNDEKAKFLAILPEIVSSVVKSSKLASTPDIASRIKKLIEYNSVGGDKARGLMTVCAYQMLEDPGKITEETLRLARILGWCVELFQTSLIILDDMVDKSTSRRGSLCWYRLPDVGVLTMSDSFLMFTVIFDIINENFSNKPRYSEILSTFNEALRHLCIGQYEPSPKEYSSFTIENFNSYSYHRRSYYTFKLPVYLSLFLANKDEKNVFDNVEDILKDISILLSIQNDYIDCFNDTTVSSKMGTDIQEGKCSWLSVQALARCDAAQREEFEACYGSADEQRVQRVKRLYERLQLPRLYQDTERDSYDNIVQRIKNLPSDNELPPALLLKLFEIIQEMRVD